MGTTLISMNNITCDEMGKGLNCLQTPHGHFCIGKLLFRSKVLSVVRSIEVAGLVIPMVIAVRVSVNGHYGGVCYSECPLREVPLYICFSFVWWVRDIMGPFGGESSTVPPYLRFLPYIHTLTH